MTEEKKFSEEVSDIVVFLYLKILKNRVLSQSFPESLQYVEV